MLPRAEAKVDAAGGPGCGASASLSHPLATIAVMKSDHPFHCYWCGSMFHRRHRIGRRPLYCGRSCRQRAYEHRRRGALAERLPAVPAVVRTLPGAPAYEMGRNGEVRHGLRPDGVPDTTGARPTLCGARANKVRPDFRPGAFGRDWPQARTCRTCASIARRFPPQRTLDHANDLAVMTALVGRVRAAFVRQDDLRPPVTELLSLVGLPAGALRGTPVRPQRCLPPAPARDPAQALTGATAA